MEKENKGAPLTSFEVGSTVIPQSGIYEGVELWYNTENRLIPVEKGEMEFDPEAIYDMTKDLLFLGVSKIVGENGEPLQAEAYNKKHAVSADMEEVLDHAIPMAQEDPVERLRKKGFVRGMPLLRRSCLEDFYTGSGIFTGEFGENISGITVKFTDGKTFLAEHCEPIKDVNKAILRMIKYERDRVLSEADRFVETMDYVISKIVYED